MENNQQTSESISALEAMTLQETIMMRTEQEEQNEIFHDSLSEDQWQQQLNDQLTVTGLGSQAQGKTAEGIERTESMIEGGGVQHPPTLPDYEKPKKNPSWSRSPKRGDQDFPEKFRTWSPITQ